MSDTTPPPPPMRRAFTGSCHCRATRFVVHLTIPFPAPSPDRSNAGPGNQRIYKCNCTICHKAGLTHLRLPDPAGDFALLSPLDPLRELGDYTCNEGRIHFLFCRTCGVRCFSFAGEGVVEEEEEEEEEDQDEGRKVWRVKKGQGEGLKEGGMYLSVNACAIDAEQDGFDMREWTEKKLMWYLDCLHVGDKLEAPNTDRPITGGCY